MVMTGKAGEIVKMLIIQPKDRASKYLNNKSLERLAHAFEYRPHCCEPRGNSSVSHFPILITGTTYPTTKHLL